nr:MAG: nonstructural protein 1 [Protoparvovirus sp.]
MSQKMESAGSFRKLLWLGRLGTSRDLSIQQTKEILITKDYVALPLPVLEPMLRQFDMKTFQALIFQISIPNGEPIRHPAAYALLFNQLETLDYWIISGEVNDKDVFHTHILCKTNSRSDSVRRSIINAHALLMNNETFQHYCKSMITEIDVLKIQRAHKPTSLYGYMLKNPEWVCSNNDSYLEIGYNINEHELNARFKQPDETPQAPDMNIMAKEITSCIVKYACKSFEDIIKSEPEMMSKWLHKPGLKTIVENCLTYAKATKGTWSLQKFDDYDPNPETIHKYLLHQGINPTHFDEVFHKWINKQSGKKNTILLLGPSNTGKTSFIMGLKECVPWGECVNGPNFNYEGLIDARIGVWEEPLISPENAEKWKQIAEGADTSIPVKYRKPYLLNRVPLIMTSNHPPWRFCSNEMEAMKNRMHIFHCNHPVQDVPYRPRTSNRGCKCRYCTASSGGQITVGQSESCGVQRTNQPLHSGEHTTGTTTVSDVGTGPMSDPDEGTSRTTGSRKTTSTDSITTDSISSSSSTSIVGYLRPSRPDGSSDSRDGISTSRSITEQHVESQQHREHNAGDMGGNGGSGGWFRRRDGNLASQYHSVSALGTRKRVQKTNKTKVQSKQQKVDRDMGAIVGANNIPMYVPLGSDWKEYFSFLYKLYG